MVTISRWVSAVVAQGFFFLSFVTQLNCFSSKLLCFYCSIIITIASHHLWPTHQLSFKMRCLLLAIALLSIEQESRNLDTQMFNTSNFVSYSYFYRSLQTTTLVRRLESLRTGSMESAERSTQWTQGE
jgi:hypothetical protein